MISTISRRRFLKGAADGALVGAAAAVGATEPAGAATLDAQFDSPFAPYPTIRHPSSWYAFTGLTEVVIPAGVYVSNQQLAPMRDVEGHPDPGQLPPDVTLLCLFHQPLPQPGAGAQLPPRLNGATMRFSRLNGGNTVQFGFRKFSNGWTATSGGQLYGLQAWVWVGPEAGDEWQTVQPIVDSISVPA